MAVTGRLYVGSEVMSFEPFMAIASLSLYADSEVIPFESFMAVAYRPYPIPRSCLLGLVAVTDRLYTRAYHNVKGWGHKFGVKDSSVASLHQNDSIERLIAFVHCLNDLILA